MIVPGQIEHAVPGSGEWAFVDIGFAKAKKSCGLLVGNGQPQEMSFAALRSNLVSIAQCGMRPLNLVLEAPLSVAFNAEGNPTGRAVERRDGVNRYWYVGLGCSVLISAMYLLRAIHDTSLTREIRLYEGLVSFKTKGERSSHTKDVLMLRQVIWEPASGIGSLVHRERLASGPQDVLQSAFAVAGMDFGVPSIIIVGA